MPDPTARLSTAIADRYRIERHLGEGGMATVYLAHDLKHDRNVALKVLRPELAAVIGAERFLAEIKTTANLQHPNILPLFDSGDADGQLFYVMPYVEGESLRDKLTREKQLPVRVAVEIAEEVASALDYAHRQGVIHRDIKPENVLMHDGRALVADFGIALALSSAGSTRMTESGMSLGTPHYMSPEQAMGEREITARSDVYALGAMLYEMLVGEPPFTGPTAQAIIARLVTEDPRPLTIQRKTIPPYVDAAVMTALQKLPADRFATAAEFEEALEGGRAVGPYGGKEIEEKTTALPPYRLPALFGIVTVLLAAIAAWGWLRPRPTPPERQQAVDLATLKIPGVVGFAAAIAPDGSAIVYSDTVGGAGQLLIKERGALAPRVLAPVPVILSPPGPAFSPDGQWIAYADGKAKKIARGGGAPIVLSDSAVAAASAWLDDGTLLFVGLNQDRLFATTEAGGPMRTVLRPDTVQGQIWRVAPVPHTHAALVTIMGPTGPRVIALDLTTGAFHTLVNDAGAAWVVPGDVLVYAAAGGQLLATKFDPRRLTTRGSPVTILAGIRTVNGVADAVVGADGTLLYVEGSATALGGRAQVRSVAMTGTATGLDTAVVLTPSLNGGLALSPDGTRLALSQTDTTTGRLDITTLRLSDGVLTRLTFQGTNNLRPTWSSNGHTILYASDAGGKMGLWTRLADGSGRPQPVATGEERPVWEGLWSPDGKWIVYRTDDAAAGNGDILAVKTSGDTTPVPLVATSAEETSPALSPDGHWLAYSATVSGRKEIYVRPFPHANEGIWQVSTDGGTEARWSHDGRELFYRNAAGEMIAVDVTGTPTFSITGRRTLFNASGYWANDDSHYYAVTPDNRHFIMLQTPQEANTGSGRTVLVENWLPAVRKKLGS